ncbi:MAG: DUF4172 domain-containing protein, partial [Acidobacteriia bacterium]|nr:DUF4172 domain-containing protein [Terriglobia bacterium]
MSLALPTYIHELPNWPRFTWNQGEVSRPLAAVRHQQGRLIGRMESLGFGLRQPAVQASVPDDVVKKSENQGVPRAP